ncbi:hypothetical protein HS088_TW19G00314 [Tripterygium wilfordii]|uniref:Uncharacterized protein n=1 Tax=Tripterygium wilfordii TaxID=458696 RepID=A0A7J7C9B7_TRIWF|nr:hypothetical protein HS088_TW19G00314 [Tripterygium wilfordii]
MAISTRAIIILLLSLVVITMMIVVRSSKVVSHGFPVMKKKIERERRISLRKLGYDALKIEYYRRRLAADPERVSPGGPDPQHH